MEYRMVENIWVYKCWVSDLNAERFPDIAGTGGGQFEPVHLQPGVWAESQQFVFCEDLSAGSSAWISSVWSTVETTAKLGVAAKIIIIFFTFWKIRLFIVWPLNNTDSATYPQSLRPA